MARMHTRRKGKSGSAKPFKSEVKCSLSEKQVKDLVEDLRKKDYSYSKIGITLRDSYGVPDIKAVTKTKLGNIIKEKGLTPKYPEDLMNLMKKAVGLKNHLDGNNHDVHNKRSLQLIESKINRLVKYYRNKGQLPAKWSYSYDKAKLLVE
ncbi:MAG: 30S ribosomal protein S15 [Candidatus Nanoarchaeia archaeon]|jgi:small subunit ribosomal protein S15